MLFVLWLVGLLGAWGFTAIVNKNNEFTRLLVKGTMMYFMFYIVVSGILIWLDSFSMIKASAGVIIVDVVLSITLAAVFEYGMPKIKFSKANCVCILCLVIPFAVLSQLNKAEMFLSGQDQGLYQFKAMHYIGGDYRNYNDFQEYYNLESDYEKYYFLTRLQGMTGVYLTNPVDTENETMYDIDLYSENITEYTLHGIATFPALLALWGKMFGLVHMTDILTLFYVLSIAGVWIICDNLKMKKTTSVFAGIMTGICPIALWSSQITLPECCLTMIVVLFFTYITEKPSKKIWVVSVIPMVAFCFYHISIIIVAPMFLVIYLWNYLNSKRKELVFAVIIFMIAFACGINMMNTYNEVYVAGNIWSVIRVTHYLVNYDNYLAVFTILPICGIVATIIIHVICSSLRIQKKIHSVKETKGFAILGKIISSLIVIAIIALSVIKWIYFASSGNLVMTRYTMLGILSMTGYLLFPVAMISLIMYSKKFFGNAAFSSVSIGLAYIIIVYVLCIFPNIYYYYYYFRYFSPYMMFIIIPAMYMLDHIDFKITGILVAGMMSIMICENPLLFYVRDLTYGEYESLESIASCVGENDVVLLYDDQFSISEMYMIPIKALTGATVFFYDKNNPDIQCETLATMYDNVFRINFDYGHDDEELRWRHVYQQMMYGTVYTEFVSSYPPYPVDYTEMPNSIGLFIYQGINN